MRTETIDLNFRGSKAVTATFLLLGESGALAALVETGPATCLESLLRGLTEHGVSPEDVRQVFLTHVHLDHAGAAGHLAELHLLRSRDRPLELGDARGRRDPLLRREDGRALERGTPVPEERLAVLYGGEELEAADGVLVAHHMPGHAYHHLAYLEPGSGTLFAGDVAGIRLPNLSYVSPPTSPPDLNPRAWKRSIGLTRALNPSSIHPTHFGSFDDVERHLARIIDEGR
jgi:glyoxylase-like metal-dependent hydrolase (beta-lactamase superfamily II)